MGLDAFKSGGPDKNDDDEEQSDDSTDDDERLPTETGVDYNTDTDFTLDYDGEYEHPSGRKDFRAEYPEDRFKECWRCSEREVKISWLSNLGNVWFCQNEDCRKSVQYHCEVTASPTQLASELDYKKLHSRMKEEQFDPSDMALENFTSTDSTDNSTAENKRKSQMFTRDRFEEVLGQTDYDWERVDYNWTREWVYEVGSSDGGFVMRIYSSVDKRNGKSRPKDGDAIRLVVLYGEDHEPVLREKRTNRIKTWPKNLKKKIDNIKQRKDDIAFCDECGSVMVIRENSESGDKFYGCGNYPKCTNTKSID
jgi:hypothetical protein